MGFNKTWQEVKIAMSYIQLYTSEWHIIYIYYSINAQNIATYLPNLWINLNVSKINQGFGSLLCLQKLWLFKKNSSTNVL